jgi:hypothetical protein
MDFNAKEEQVIRYLFKHFTDGNSSLLADKVCEDNNLTSEEQTSILTRLQIQKAIDGGYEFDPKAFACTGKVSFTVMPKICDLVSELDHRPPVNHWQKFLEKWFSNRWSIPLTALFFLAPIIAQYVTWGYGAYKWYKGEPASKTAPQQTTIPPSQTAQQQAMTSPAQTTAPAPQMAPKQTTTPAKETGQPISRP